jgi:type I restriction enzyme M protein
VGVNARGADEFVFADRLMELSEELEVLNTEARDLEERIAENITYLIEASAQ